MSVFEYFFKKTILSNSIYHYYQKNNVKNVETIKKQLKNLEAQKKLIKEPKKM